MDRGIFPKRYEGNSDNPKNRGNSKGVILVDLGYSVDMSNYASHSFLDIPDVNEPTLNILETKSASTPVYKPYYNTYDKTGKEIDLNSMKERNSTIVKAYVTKKGKANLK